jgi:hypothetical protein
MKGFATKQPVLKTSKYWVSCYKQGDEDDPISVDRTEIQYKPGECKEQKILFYCDQLFKTTPDIWEILVHQGPESVPESGDQVVARLSREPFEGSQVLVA